MTGPMGSQGDASALIFLPVLSAAGASTLAVRSLRAE